MGRAAGATTVLVRTGYGLEDDDRPDGLDGRPGGRQPDGRGRVDTPDGSGRLGLTMQNSRIRQCSRPANDERQSRLLASSIASPQRRVAVVGDIMADEFLTGQISRVSREAPVLILQLPRRPTIVPGGGGNAANNVAALGGRRGPVRPGRARTTAGARCCEAFPPPVRQPRRDAAGRVPHADQDARAGGRHPLGQAADRPDRPRAVRPAAGARCSRRSPRGCWPRSTGRTPCCSPTTATASSRRCWPTRSSHKLQRRPARPVPVLVDSRYNLGAFRDVTACTPNQPEVEQLLGMRINDDVEALERAGRDAAAAAADERRARHARQPRHVAVRAEAADASTSRSSAATRSPTSPARATP